MGTQKNTEIDEPTKKNNKDNQGCLKLERFINQRSLNKFCKAKIKKIKPKKHQQLEQLPTTESQPSKETINIHVHILY